MDVAVLLTAWFNGDDAASLPGIAKKMDDEKQANPVVLYLRALLLENTVGGEKQGWYYRQCHDHCIPLAVRQTDWKSVARLCRRHRE